MATNLDLRRTDVAEGVLLVSYLMHEIRPIGSQKKIIEKVATRCQILRLKWTKFNFGWRPRPSVGSDLKSFDLRSRSNGHVGPDPAGGAYSAPQTP